MDTGLLLLRITIGLAVAAHGAQKVFGWFGGHGPDATGSAGYPVCDTRDDAYVAGSAGMSE